MPALSELLSIMDEAKRYGRRRLSDIGSNPDANVAQAYGAYVGDPMRERALRDAESRSVMPQVNAGPRAEIEREAIDGLMGIAGSTGPAGFVRPSYTGGTLFPRNHGMYSPVPQTVLPVGPGGRAPVYNERMQSLLDSRAAGKHVDRLISKGKDLGMTEWYGTEPLRQVALNEGLTHDEFNRFMAHMSSASQRNPVDQQNRMGSYMWHLDKSGLLLPETKLMTNKLRGAGEGGSDYIALPEGYGSLAQGAIFDRSRQIANGGIEQALPPYKKLGRFYRNLLGNLDPVTVDVNAVKGPVMSAGRPDWLKTLLVEKDDRGNVVKTMRPLDEYNAGTMSLKDALKRPGLWEDAPKSAAEYHGFENLYKRAAKRNDIMPAEGQATAWYGSADIAALKTKPELYIDNLERHIRETAKLRGKSDMQMLQDMLHGRDYLYGATGGGTGMYSDDSRPVPLSDLMHPR